MSTALLLLEILVILGFFLFVVVKYLMALRRKRLGLDEVDVNRWGHRYIRYFHHGRRVVVREDLKEFHRDFCMCFDCGLFCPENREANCLKANRLYKLCVSENMVTPVFECPDFVMK